MISEWKIITAFRCDEQFVAGSLGKSTRSFTPQQMANAQLFIRKRTRYLYKLN